MSFSTIKKIYGSSMPSIIPLLSADAMTLLKEKKNINDQWREDFSGLLNSLSTVDPGLLDQIPQKPTINSVDFPPTMEEVEKAINQISSNKDPAMNRIPVEIYKAAGPVTLKMFDGLLINIWADTDMPKGFQRCNSCSTL